MTRPLYYAGGGDLQEATDAQLALLRYNLLVAYGNEMINGSHGAFSVVATGGNSSFATDTVRTSRTSRSSFPGTGTGTSTVYRYNQNHSTGSIATGFDRQTLYWDGNDVRRHGGTALATNVFNNVRDTIRNGGYGAYRIQVANPGGWTNVSLAFRDTVFGLTNTDYRLWHNRQVPTAPTGTFPNFLHYAGGGDLQEIDDIGINSTFMQNWLLPVFNSWANDNGLQLRVNTGGGTNIVSTFTDRVRSGTTNTLTGRWQNNTDVYTSSPSGGTTNVNVYRLRYL